MNRYRLVHITQFSYDGPVTDSYNEVRLWPLQDDYQSCLMFQLKTDPPVPVAMHVDYFGNTVQGFNVLHAHRRLRIEADSVVLVQDPRPLPENGVYLSNLDNQEADVEEQFDFLCPTDYVPHLPALREFVEEAEAVSGGTCSGFASVAMRMIHDRFKYEKGATHVHSSIGDSLSLRSGVCQDFAHILLAVLRMRGLPARYVSGYLVPLRTAQPGASVEEVVGGQASHAWTEVYIPGEGWFGLDPTLGAPVGLQHVRIAYGRDYGDVAPIRGVYKGHAGQHMSVDVRVRPALDEEGREILQETAAAPVVIPDAPAHQPQQQQQQQ
jgi:transglutaminase-like putative cysteine protease